MACLVAEQNGTPRSGHSRTQAVPLQTQGRAWMAPPLESQVPRLVTAIPGGLAEPITGVQPLVVPSFDQADANRDGVVSRQEFQNATGGMVYAAPQTVRTMSPLPRARVLYPQARAVSPETSRSPMGRRIVASPTTQAPASTISTVRAAQPLTVPHINVVPPSEANLSEDLLKRIDGVVSEMERELSDDLTACVKSPLAELKQDIKAELAGEEDNDSTLDWIDKQIRNIEGRREACESRQQHLSDLRRLVADRERRRGREDLDDEPVGVRESPKRRLSILEGEHEELKKQVETERVELLKVRANLEMECERRLQEARSLAESVQESRQRAIAAEEAAQQRSSEATGQVQLLQERLRDAETTLERERQQFRLAQEAQMAAGADLRQLSENSRTVLADCQALQQKVRELELERSVFLEVQAKSEEERRALVARLRQLEEEKARDIEGVVHAHREQWREAANCDMQQMRASLTATHNKNLKAGELKEAQLMAELEELKGHHGRLQMEQEKLKADLAAEVRAKEQFQRQHQLVTQDLEKLQRDQQALSKDKLAEQAARQKAEQEHEAVLRDAERLRADHQRVSREKEEEARLRQEAERKHQEVQKDLNKMKDDQLRLKSDKEAEERAKLEVQRLHQAVLDEKNSLHGNHSHLQELLSAEKKAKDEMQRRHTMVESDKMRVERDKADLEQARAREEQLKQEAEKKHQQLLQDMERLRADQAQLQADKEDEKRAREEAERKHAAVLLDMQRLEADRGKLQADQAAERRAREEAERKHSEVSQDRDKIHIDLRKMQGDKEAEERARQEMERRHEAATKQIELVNADSLKLKMDKDSALQARLDMEAKHQAAVRDLELLRSEKEALHGQHQASRTQLEALQEELSSLKVDLKRAQAERDRLESTHSDSSKGHEEAYAKLRSSHEAELKLSKEQSLQLKVEWEQRHQSLLSELEQVRGELRRAQQGQDEERRLKERAQADLQQASRESDSLQVQVQTIQSRRSSDLGSLEDAQSRIRSLTAANGTLSHDVDTLKKMKHEREEAERDLREALNTQKAELKTVQRRLEERELQVKQFEGKLSELLAQLSDEKKEGEDLRRELTEAQSSSRELQRSGEEALEKLRALQAENEELRREAARRGEEAARKRMTVPRMSLWAVPPVLAVEEEAELLVGSRDEFIVQVRDAHKGVDSLMQSAAEVHIRTISAQLEGAAEAESKGLGVRRGLSDYEKQYEIQSERRSELNNLEARLHDLRALKEEVALQHHLNQQERDQVMEYLERDMKRCDEEIEIMRPASALSSLPDELIQVLMHMDDEGLPEEFENGFSPLHWAAQRGRRDLVEFIRQQVDGGSELLQARDSQGRIPLFFAERSGKQGLAYHLRRIGGATELVRTAQRRPDTEDLAPAYKKVLEQIEQRGWQSMKWKDDFTMLHWAASHGKKELCMYLLSQQANPMDQDNKGRTPAAVATEAGHLDVVAAIQDKVTIPRKSVSHLAFPSLTE